MGARVLVVDDDPGVLKLLQVNFELEGYDVEMASNGQAALDAIHRAKPDVVICDVMMPGLTGLDVVRKLRSEPATATLPVVVVSAKAQRADLQAGLDAGADEYVTKPFDPQDLLDTVARLLKPRRK